MRFSILVGSVVAFASSVTYGAPLRSRACNPYISQCPSVKLPSWSVAQGIFNPANNPPSLNAKSVDEDSGAFNIHMLAPGAEEEVNPNLLSQLTAREFSELLVRALDGDEESDAISWSTIKSIGKGIWDVGKEVFGSSGNNTRRDFEELFERAAETGDIESGAFSLGSLLKGLGGVVSSIFGGGSSSNQQQRREFIELLARAADEDESGAFSVSGLLKGIGSVIGGIFGGGSTQQQRREFIELLARASVDDDESGAFSIGGLFKGLTSVISGILGGGSSSQQQSREFVEFLARSEGGAELLRRLATL